MLNDSGQSIRSGSGGDGGARMNVGKHSERESGVCCVKVDGGKWSLPALIVIRGIGTLHSVWLWAGLGAVVKVSVKSMGVSRTAGAVSVMHPTACATHMEASGAFRVEQTHWMGGYGERTTASMGQMWQRDKLAGVFPG